MVVLPRRTEFVLKSHGRFQHAASVRRLPREGIVEGDCRLVAVEPIGRALLGIERAVDGCILRHVHFRLNEIMQ